MQKNSNKTTINAGLQRPVAVLLISLALFLGIAMGFIVAVVIGDLGGKSNQTQLNPQLNNGQYYDTEYIDSVINLFEQRYIGEISQEDEDVTYNMVKGFIESLDDRYTTFFTPDEAKEYLQQSSGDFEGVGISLSYDPDSELTFVETVIKGNPAESAGMLPGDVIIEVDEEDVTSLLPSQVAGRIRGEKGSNVKLTILRDKSGSYEELSFDITRGLIEIDSISWKKIDNKTVQIDIAQFSDDSVESFQKNWDNVVDEIEDEVPGVEDIVVNLRNNPGGFVYGVRYVLEEFLDSDQIIMKERTKNQEETVYKDQRKGAFEDKDIVVLVNEGSASASEIFASAIQENDKGEVVGMPTVGKGVEQELLEFTDGSILLIVFQEWLTPDGNRISEESPIKPDHEVDYTIDNFKNGTDPQLDKALEVVKN